MSHIPKTYNLLHMIEAAQGFGNSAFTVLPGHVARDVKDELERLYELETVITQLSRRSEPVQPQVLRELLS